MRSGGTDEPERFVRDELNAVHALFSRSDVKGDLVGLSGLLVIYLPFRIRIKAFHELHAGVLDGGTLFRGLVHVFP